MSFSFPRDLPDPGIEPRSLTLQADALPPEKFGIYAAQLSVYKQTLSLGMFLFSSLRTNKIAPTSFEE